MNTLAKLLKKVFIALIILVVIFLVYFFYHPKIDLQSYAVLENPFYQYVNEMPLWLYLIICFIIISFFNIIILISLSFYFDYIRRRRQNLIKKYESFFTQKICEYLLTDNYKDNKSILAFLNTIKLRTKKRIQTEAFFSIFTKIQETLRVDFSVDFKKIIKDLNLEKEIKKLLFSNDFGNRILALKTLSYLRISDYKNTFVKYSKSKNYALRNEAIAALLRIRTEEQFQDNEIGDKYFLSLLDINVIINAILKNNKENLINHESLISSKNERKKILGILLAKYQLTKNPGDLSQNVVSDDNLLKKIEWNSLLSFLDKNESVDFIISRYNNEPEDVRLYILQQSHKLNDKRYFDLLNFVIETEPLLHKIEALKILFKHDLNRFIGFMNSKDNNIVLAYNEVSDVFIND